jgi:hypothetical protein
MTFGSVLAKCLPKRVKTVITDAIPDREVMVDIANTLARFEEDLKEIKKEQTRARGEGGGA